MSEHGVTEEIYMANIAMVSLGASRTRYDETRILTLIRYSAVAGGYWVHEIETAPQQDHQRMPGTLILDSTSLR